MDSLDQKNSKYSYNFQEVNQEYFNKSYTDLEQESYEIVQSPLNANNRSFSILSMVSIYNYDAPGSKMNIIGNREKKKVSNMYKELLFAYSDSSRLSEYFMKSTRPLRISDAKDTSFSFRACANRMLKGYEMWFFSYSSGLPAKFRVTLDGYGVLLKEARAPERRIHYQEFKGILLGDRSYTFTSYKSHGFKLKDLGLESTDCFSLITTHRGFDFASPSERVKYDIYIVFSFYVTALNGAVSPCIGLSKREHAVYKMKLKLKEMAAERYMSLKELLLLAILKTIADLKIGAQAFQNVSKILDRSLQGSAKIYRLCKYFLPANYKASNKFISQYMNIKRISILSRRMAFQIFNKNSDSVIKLLGSWSKIKNSSLIYAFESFKQYLKNRMKAPSKANSPQKSDCASPLKIDR